MNTNQMNTKQMNTNQMNTKQKSQKYNLKGKKTFIDLFYYTDNEKSIKFYYYDNGKNKLSNRIYILEKNENNRLDRINIDNQLYSEELITYIYMILSNDLITWNHLKKLYINNENVIKKDNSKKKLFIDNLINIMNK